LLIRAGEALLWFPKARRESCGWKGHESEMLFCVEEECKLLDQGYAGFGIWCPKCGSDNWKIIRE
jgi:hypothetical protein